MKLVNVHEAKTHLSKLLERAHAGEEVIIGKGGRPYARLVPLKPAQRRVAGLLGNKQLGDSFFDELPQEELEGWER
ncbi:MAG: type II toxin-antitoxin system prevent-host-death family antitoxin [Proteobacteria bacterium]|nr:type II toxin-antitoxin system prevent-host-death family antitoxin [Pseudomonadota bacterium]